MPLAIARTGLRLFYLALSRSRGEGTRRPLIILREHRVRDTRYAAALVNKNHKLNPPIRPHNGIIVRLSVVFLRVYLKCSDSFLD